MLLAGAVTGLGPAAASAAACQAWTGVPPPSPGTSANGFNGVAVLPPCDAWAVGSDEDGTGLNQTLIEHWNGSAWTVVASPDVTGEDNFLNGVRAVSANDIWAVGESAGSGADQTLILHWNGSKWAQVPSPSPNPGTDNFLSAVAASSASNAWAVGWFTGDNGH